MTFQKYGNMAKGDGGKRGNSGGKKREEKDRTKGLLPVLVASAAERLRKKDRGRGGKRHTGTDRHNNNTHAGQEKSISVSLAQKSRYGCNFMFFFR